MRYTNVRYSTLLNEAQYDYLSDECQDINRMKCFKTFVRLAVMEQTKRNEDALFSCPTARAVHGFKGRAFPDVGLQPKDRHPNHQGV